MVDIVVTVLILHPKLYVTEQAGSVKREVTHTPPSSNGARTTIVKRTTSWWVSLLAYVVTTDAPSSSASSAIDLKKTTQSLLHYTKRVNIVLVSAGLNFACGQCMSCLSDQLQPVIDSSLLVCRRVLS